MQAAVHNGRMSSTCWSGGRRDTQIAPMAAPPTVAAISSPPSEASPATCAAYGRATAIGTIIATTEPQPIATSMRRTGSAAKWILVGPGGPVAASVCGVSRTASPGQGRGGLPLPP